MTDSQKRTAVRLVKRIAKLMGTDIEAEVERLSKMPSEDVEKEFRDIFPTMPMPSDYREIPWAEGVLPRLYAFRVLASMLPKFEDREKAMEALTIKHPYTSKENVLLKIAGALYFTRRDA